MAEKYRKKPAPVDAELWVKGLQCHGGAVEIRMYLSEYSIIGKDTCQDCGKIIYEHGRCPTERGEDVVCPGDWILKDENGNFHVCHPDTFEDTYELTE